MPVDAAAAGRNLPAPLAFFPLTGEQTLVHRVHLLARENTMRSSIILHLVDQLP